MIGIGYQSDTVIFERKAIRFGSDLLTRPEAQNINQTKEEVDKPFRAYATSTKRYEGMNTLN